MSPPEEPRPPPSPPSPSPPSPPPGGQWPPEQLPQASARSRRISLVWVVPLFALAIVSWLAWRTLARRGPAITITFISAEGLQAGQTEIRHKGVRIGMVESFELSRDMSEVIVHARMTAAVRDHLNQGTRFWIVEPRVGTNGISGLTTLVSGAYIDMYPGTGGPQRQFVGLEAPPVLQPDVRGRTFTLTAAELGAVGSSTPITYRGVDVGQIEGYTLDATARHVNIYAFVRAPYDVLVHDGTRFWDASAIDVSAGAQGIRVRLNSLQQLVTGAIAFDDPTTTTTTAAATAAAATAAATPGTSPTAPTAPEAAAGTIFPLYENQTVALSSHSGPRLIYQLRFAQSARGLDQNTPVELHGTQVGQVTHSQLMYDTVSRQMYQAATISIDPGTIAIRGAAHAVPQQQAAAVRAGLQQLVAHGLRAQLLTASFLTGQKVVALEIVPGAPPARIRVVDGGSELPTTTGADIDDILRNLQGTLQHIDRATAGPQLEHALTSLDGTLTHLDQVTGDLAPAIKPLLASFGATADATQSAAKSANNVMGPDSALATQLPQLLKDVGEAARSIRELADYLDRHPDAIIRGRREDPPP